MKDTGPTGVGQKTLAFTIEELTVGGAERMLVAMANAFVHRGWRVHMVCLKDAGELAAELDPAVSVHVLHKRRGIDVSLPPKLLRCLRQINPQCVNSHLWVANTWTRIALLHTRIPVVATEHSRDTWKPWLYRKVDRLLATRTAALVTVSADTADFYREKVGVDDALIRVINNGVDTQRYANGSGVELRNFWLGQVADKPTDKQVLLGTVGRLVAAKNHPRLIDALKILVDDEDLHDYLIKLVVVGEGSEQAAIERHVHAANLQNSVIFTGIRHDIPDVLAAFDLFVLSSDREGHPLTALEAQAAGTPVVLTNAGGAGEAIARLGKDTGGMLVEKSAEALAAALREMILNTVVRQEQSSFAKRFALANFDTNQMVERYEMLFQSVVK